MNKPDAFRRGGPCRHGRCLRQAGDRSEPRQHASTVFACSAETLAAIIQPGTAKKGDVLGTARLAGIMAAKRTADLIPLCHPLPITAVTVELSFPPIWQSVDIVATVTHHRHARAWRWRHLTAAIRCGADRVRHVQGDRPRHDRSMALRVVHKDGGKSGVFSQPLNRPCRQGAQGALAERRGGPGPGAERVLCRPAVEIVGLGRWLGTACWQLPIAARLTQPPADVSAMDGYALRASGYGSAPPARDRRRGAGRAGLRKPRDGRRPGGAAVHRQCRAGSGADTILLQEDAAQGRRGWSCRISVRRSLGQHIRQARPGFRSPETSSFEPGRRLGARDRRPGGGGQSPVADRCTGGRASPFWRQATKSPFPAKLIGEGGIVSSNSSCPRSALIRAAGGEPCMLPVARDDAGNDCGRRRGSGIGHGHAGRPPGVQASAITTWSRRA